MDCSISLDVSSSFFCCVFFSDDIFAFFSTNFLFSAVLIVVVGSKVSDQIVSMVSSVVFHSMLIVHSCFLCSFPLNFCLSNEQQLRYFVTIISSNVVTCLKKRRMKSILFSLKLFFLFLDFSLFSDQSNDNCCSQFSILRSFDCRLDSKRRILKISLAANSKIVSKKVENEIRRKLCYI